MAGDPAEPVRIDVVRGDGQPLALVRLLDDGGTAEDATSPGPTTSSSPWTRRSTAAESVRPG